MISARQWINNRNDNIKKRAEKALFLWNKIFYDVALGCSNNEHQAEEYFRDDVYENSAEVFELCLDLTIVRHDDEIWIFDNDTDYQK